MIFHALTFARFGGSCLNTRPLGQVFNHRPRDPASVNAMKQAYVIVILAYLPDFSINRPENVAKTLNIHFLTLDFLDQNGVSVNFRTSLRRHNVIYTRATFSRMKASA